MSAHVSASVSHLAVAPSIPPPLLSLLQYDKIYWHVQMGNLVYSLLLFGSRHNQEN